MANILARHKEKGDRSRSPNFIAKPAPARPFDAKLFYPPIMKSPSRRRLAGAKSML